MAYRRRRAPNKGKRCTSWKRVRVRGGGTVRRCRKFGGSRASSSYRRRTSATRRRRKPVGMARRGSHCVRKKRVYSKVLRKRVWRCATFR